MDRTRIDRQIGGLALDQAAGLALPDKDAMARPTGVGRADASSGPVLMCDSWAMGRLRLDGGWGSLVYDLEIKRSFET